MSKFLEGAREKFGVEKVVAKLSEIIAMLPKENSKTIDVQKAQNQTLWRLLRLKGGDWNVEYILVGCQIIEHAIKRLIHTHEFFINSSLVLGDFDNVVNVKAETEAGNKTLGALIDELRRFCKNDSLFGKLGQFNGIRKKVAHQMYKENWDIELVNAEIRQYVSNDPVKEIIEILAKIHHELVMALMAKLKEFGVQEVGPPNFS